MKKIILILLVFFGLQTKAQVSCCDSISYTTTSTLNYPLILSGDASGLANMVDSITWSWTVCNSALCYSGSGANASFGQVSVTDTLKVCYDVIIELNSMTYACSSCDSLVYNPNSYQWEKITAQPLTVMDLKPNIINDNKMYDLLGREIFEIPNRIVYIKNGKKYITNGR